MLKIMHRHRKYRTFYVEFLHTKKKTHVYTVHIPFRRQRADCADVDDDGSSGGSSEYLHRSIACVTCASNT